jgi:primosomal protein N' (replication factor Y)
VPDELESEVHSGVCVAVPFSGRELVGYILELTDTAPDIGEIKDLAAVIPDACVLSPPLMAVARWMSGYYSSSLAHAVRAVVPEVMSATVASTVRLVDPGKVSPSSARQSRLVEVLADMGGEADADTLRARAKIESFVPTLRQLRNRGAVEVVRALELPKARPLIVRGVQAAKDGLPEPEEIAPRAPKQAALLKELAGSEGPVRQAELLRRVGASASPVRALVDKGFAEKVDLRVRREPLRPKAGAGLVDLELTEEQREALIPIIESIRSGTPRTTLLYGVTGSGKTEVYLRSIAEVLDRGGSCIALVPEISLTAHLMGAYHSRFGDRIAILHSRLSTGERHDEWRRIESGEARVVLGARSAVFAPVRDLGLIVVDEEHEPSYKQDHSPRYHARRVAEERAGAENASVILGSATPSVETFRRASVGEIGLQTLSKRIDDRPMPTVRLVDLREEFEAGRRSFFSGHLQEAVAQRLASCQQVILFVNRRGYASFVLCRTCGYTARCGNCDVSLTLHAAQRMLRCHHCNESHPAPTICPKCGGPHIRQFGVGTERVEEETRKLFPAASVIRMDSDTTSRKGSHFRLLEMFGEGKADILVGTQMVAKGFDFPNVTLVGVISADTSLHMPDFRAAERTFQLLTQVSGRAGRGDIPGEVIVQSFSTEHYAVLAAVQQDYMRFYEQEIEFRRELSYPPFAQLVNIVSSDPIDGYAEGRLGDLAARIGERMQGEGVDMLGPAPAPISKLKGLYRWHLLLRDRRSHPAGDLQRIIQDALDEIPVTGRTGLTVDVDPLTML